MTSALSISAITRIGPLHFGHSRGSIGAASSVRASSIRPQDTTNLVDALKGVLAGKTLSVGEAVEKVIEADYKSTSASFHQIVSQTFSHSDQFERVGRGQYTATHR